MTASPAPPDERWGFEAGFVSTGHLPFPERVQELVDTAYETFRFNTEGANSQVYPALARAPSDLFGISVIGVDGGAYRAWTDGREVVVVLETAWDTEADARAFEDVATAWIGDADGAAVQRSDDEVTLVFATDPDLLADLGDA